MSRLKSIVRRALDWASAKGMQQPEQLRREELVWMKITAIAPQVRAILEDAAAGTAVDGDAAWYESLLRRFVGPAAADERLRGAECLEVAVGRLKAALGEEVDPCMEVRK